MLLIGLISLLIAIPLSSSAITPTLLTRTTSILLLYSAVLSYNCLYLQAIGSGLGLYSGLFHVTSVTQAIEIFLLTAGSIILLPWIKEIKVESDTAGDTRSPDHRHVNLGKNDTLSEYLGVSRDSHLTLESRLDQKELTQSTVLISEYPLIILFTTTGALFLISSCDLVSMYLSIELQSFAVYILAAIYRNSESSTSAGLKYFLLGALSSALILLGSSLIYTYTGLTHFESLNMLSSVALDSENNRGSLFISLGVLIICVGFLFKVAAAPFHHWAPDVYDGVPTIVTTWLTIIPKISIFVFLLEMILIGNQIGLALGAIELKTLLLTTSLLSLVIGTVVGLAQYRLKRLLAYSTVSHVGFLLLALSVNSEESITSFLFYLMQYSITNLDAFLVVLALGYMSSSYLRASNNPEKSATETITNRSYRTLFVPKFTLGKNQSSGTGNFSPQTANGNPGIWNQTSNLRDLTLIAQLKGHFFANPVLGLSLAICLFSIAGIPPLIGFFAKYIVLYSAIENGYRFLAFVGILASVISAAYYLRVIRVIHFDAKKEDLPEANSSALAGSVSLDDSGNQGIITEQVTSPDNYNDETSSALTSTHSYIIAVLTLTIVLFILAPSFWLNSSNLLALSLFTA